MRVGDIFCPGVLHAVSAKDGLLLRIRMPGGLIHSNQLKSIAELSATFSDGQIEITSRANIQLRGIKPQDLSKAADCLRSIGLLPSSTHDRVRNIIASPLAGLDTEELIDTRPLVRELDDRLCSDPVLAKLNPKFSMALDGGGRWFSRETDDLALRAVNTDEGLRFHFRIGGRPSGLGVTTDRAVDCMLEAARICLRIAKQFDIPVRGRRITFVPEAFTLLMECLSKIHEPCPFPDPVGVKAAGPVGISPTSQAGLLNLIPSVPLGRLQAKQARVISEVAEDCDASLRLAPWRGIVLGAISETMVSRAIQQLNEEDISLEAKDGYRGLSACAGSGGCEASLADVRADAVSLAAQLAGGESKPEWTVTIAGCDKQCAMRNGATAELVATKAGYSLKLRGISVAAHCSPASAIKAAVACHADFAAEAR